MYCVLRFAEVTLPLFWTEFIVTAASAQPTIPAMEPADMGVSASLVTAPLLAQLLMVAGPATTPTRPPTRVLLVEVASTVTGTKLVTPSSVEPSARRVTRPA